MNHKTKMLLSDDGQIRMRFKKSVAEKTILLRNFLSQISNLGIMEGNPSYRLHELLGKDKGRFSLDLTANFRLLFRLGDEYYPKPPGGFNLKLVQSIID